MLISVIVPTRNRATTLAGALASLARQQAAGPFEVVVVDNGSTDATRATAAHAQDALQESRYVFEPAPGLHRARHRGMREARGEVLAYIDDDVEVGQDWIAALRDAFGDPAVAMVGGNALPAFEAPPPRWIEWLWRQPYGEGHALPSLSLLQWRGGVRDIEPSLIWGCNLSVRRELLLAARGFNPDAMPDELVRFRGDGEMPLGRFAAARGHRCLFHPGATVQHRVPAQRMTLAYFRRRAFLQGISDSFTRLREAHRPSEPRTPQPRRPSFGARVAGALYGLGGRLGPVRRELTTLRAAMAAGYAEGESFHQQAFATDPEIRAWVLRDDYLEA